MLLERKNMPLHNNDEQSADEVDVFACLCTRSKTVWEKQSGSGGSGRIWAIHLDGGRVIGRMRGWLWL